MVKSSLSKTILFATIFSAPDIALADDKSKYNLFNPTPKNEMRDMSTDRPDKTESPYTVDAGHFQIEMDFANYTYDKYKKNGENTRSHGFGVAPINMKAGLTNSTDIQLIVDNYGYSRTSDKVAGSSENSSGFGDITVRLKQNIYGNDSGDSALGIMPFVKLPSNTDNLGGSKIEGGVAFPFALSLSDDVGFGAMMEIGANRDYDNSGYHLSYAAMATIGHAINDELGQYFEIFVEESAETGVDTVVTFDTGFTYMIKENVQLDAGINIGLTKIADDFNPFVGVSYRF